MARPEQPLARPFPCARCRARPERPARARTRAARSPRPPATSGRTAPRRCATARPLIGRLPALAERGLDRQPADDQVDDALRGVAEAAEPFDPGARLGGALLHLLPDVLDGATAVVWSLLPARSTPRGLDCGCGGRLTGSRPSSIRRIGMGRATPSHHLDDTARRISHSGMLVASVVHVVGTAQRSVESDDGQSPGSRLRIPGASPDRRSARAADGIGLARRSA